jgi:hypothetical protein
MRDLPPAPSSVVDPETKLPRFGAYRGGLGKIDLGPLERGWLWTLARRKRWMYVGIASEAVWVTLAVVDLGYAGNAFAFVYDKAGRKMLEHRAGIGLPGLFSVNDASGEGHAARFRNPRLNVTIERARGSSVYTVRAVAPNLEIDARLESGAAPPGISAIAPIPGGKVNVTQKRALLTALGSVRADEKTISLDGALAGFDHTSGLLARRTSWKWAFVLGRAKSGERVGINLVQGFVGEAECAAWIDDDLVPLAEGDFSHDPARPLERWGIRTRDEKVDLQFSPGAMHKDATNLGVVRSRFVQPVGLFRGSVRLPGHAPLELDGALGVAEDQDVVW